MKITLMISIGCLSACFLVGCLPSLQPLYTDDTLVFDEQLVGKWYENDQIWSFVTTDNGAYELRVIDDDIRQAEFVVHLVQLGDDRFIDMYPKAHDAFDQISDIYKFNLLPAHTFMQIELSEPNLNINWVCLADLIEDDPNLLRHEKIEDDAIVLSADSKDIQRVIMDHVDKVTDEECGEFRRCPVVFQESDIYYDPILIGQWITAEGDYLNVAAFGESGYELSFDESENKTYKFYAVLFTCRDRTFMGLYLNRLSETEIAAKIHLVPDFLMYLEQDQSTLNMWRIDWDQMETYIRTNQLNLDQPSEPDWAFLKSDVL